MKYNVDDVVIVRKDLEYRKEYFMSDSSESNTAVDPMLLYCGKEVTIAKIDNGQYRIKEDDGTWRWTDGMFSGLQSSFNGGFLMYRKYIVYLDDGYSVYKIAIAAACEEAAVKWYSGNGEVIAVKDVTEDYPIDANRVSKALMDAGFSGNEKDWIVRLCTEFGVCE